MTILKRAGALLERAVRKPGSPVPTVAPAVDSRLRVALRKRAIETLLREEGMPSRRQVDRAVARILREVLDDCRR